MRFWPRRPTPVATGVSLDDDGVLLDADAALEDERDDGLDRVLFSDRLAHQIKRARAKTGLVVALIGPWGSGKTTVLGWVQKRLEEGQPKDDPSRVVVRFNPWLVSGSEQLVSQFVSELAVALPRRAGERRAADAAARLHRYARALQILEGAPGVGWMFGTGGALLNEIGRRRHETPETVFEQREQVCKALEALGLHVVVVIDDVDRLEDTEIRDLMRMVKLVGDFPNVTYLLAFDREPVLSALSVGQADGGQYLEKIVQIEYRLPEPRPEKLDLLLRAGLKREIPGHVLESDRWETVYTKIVLPLVSRPRHVRRLANALPLELDQAGDEVNPIDVVALTALQVLLPKFYDELRQLTEDLTPRFTQFLGWTKDEIKQASAARLTQAAERSGNPDVARTVYELLFPAAQAVQSDVYYSDEPSEWRADQRVAERDVLERFFTGTLPDDAVTVADVRAALEGFAEGPVALAAVFDYQPAEKIPALVQRVRAQAREIPAESIVPCLPVLDAQIARISDFTAGLSSPGDFVRFLIRDLVERFPEGSARDSVVEQRFEMAPSLTEKFTWLRSIGAWEDGGGNFASPETSQKLRERLAGEVLEAGVETLLKEEHPAWLLRTAEDDGGSDASDRVGTLIGDGRLLPAYLGGFLVLTTSADYQLQFDELERRQGRTRLVEAAEHVDLTSLKDEERWRVLQLREHYDGRGPLDS
ncbi:MAG TPA: P-loop NTPase fold protein [Thermoleophilaceae bacterium]|nr:P-loop NTPase fold protein [Thermoleophilaceae bacterium]